MAAVTTVAATATSHYLAAHPGAGPAGGPALTHGFTSPSWRSRQWQPPAAIASALLVESKRALAEEGILGAEVVLRRRDAVRARRRLWHGSGPRRRARSSRRLGACEASSDTPRTSWFRDRTFCETGAVDVPSRPGDALAQPTRARLFALLSELRRPAPTEELAERLGLHPNGVRAHLERLRKVGLVSRERERLARGRPRDSWMISPHAQPGGDPRRATQSWRGGWCARWSPRVRACATSRPRAAGSAARWAQPSPTSPASSACTRCWPPWASSPSANRSAMTGLPIGCATVHIERRCASASRWCAGSTAASRGVFSMCSIEHQAGRFRARDPETAGCLIELQGPMAAEAVQALADASS